MADRILKVILRGDASQLKTELAASAKSFKDTADKMTGATKESEQFRKGLSAVGDTAGKVGLVATAGLGAIVAATANFEQAMSHVAATGDEARNSLEQLREAAIQAGQDTAFSATEAAGGIENLLKAGVAAEDVLGGGLSGALDLAASGGLEVADAAEVAATALTQFKLQGQDVPHVADLLAAAAGKAQGDVSDMAAALKQSGLVAAQTGLSIEETTGTLAAFASAGLIGSDAGTSFKTMLQSLTPTSAEAAETMDRLGITAYDAQGNFIGMTEFAANLRAGLADLSVEQQNAALKTIFGSDAVRAASVIYEQGADGVQSWISKVDDAGYAAETAATRMDNLKGDFEQFTGSLETALIGSGEGSQGFLRGLVQGATRAVNVFNELPPAAQNTTTALLGITAVTGGGLWFGSKVIQGISNTREALDNLGVSSDRTSRAMKGLAVAGAGLAALAVGAAAIRSIQSATDETYPGVNRLTSQLINLANAGTTAQLSSEFDSLGESLRRITETTFREDFFDTLQKPFEGLFGEQASLRQARAEIEALDQAFANLASSGGTQMAMEAFRGLAAAQNLTVSEQRDLLGILPQFSDAIAGNANSSTLAADASGEAADGFGEMGDSADDAADQVQALSDSINGLLDPLLAQDEATVEWKRSIASLTKELKGGSNALDINTKKGRNNRDAIRERVESLKRMAQTTLEATGNQGKFTRQLISGAKEILAAGKAANISEADMRSYLHQLGLTPKQVRTVIEADTGQAEAAVAHLKSVYAGLPRTIVTQAITQHIDKFLHATNRADGGIDYFANGAENHVAQIAPAGAWRVWAEEETGGEAYIPLATSKRARSLDIWREVGHRMGVDFVEYAVGGLRGPFGLTAGGGGRGPRFSVDQRLDVLNLQQQIRQLQRDLHETGKDQLKGFARAIAEAELEKARLDLHAARRAPIREARDELRATAAGIRDARAGFDVTGDMSVKDVRAELREFREAIQDSGGEWTKAMSRHAGRLIDNAKAIAKSQRALDRETAHRDRLQDKLDEQIRVMDQLKSTMQQFNDTVAGNFTPDPFNLSLTAPAVAGPVAVDPNLLAAQASLADAQRRYRDVLAGGGDPLQRSYEASKVLAEVDQYQAQVDDLSRGAEAFGDATQQAVAGLAAFEQVLKGSTASAQGFLEDLQTLSDKGLDGPLFAALAKSGDYGLAAELAGKSPEQVDYYESLFEENAAAAGEVAAFATQEAFGQQFAAQQAAVDRANSLLEKSNQRLERIDDRIDRQTDRLASTEEKVGEAIQGGLKDIRQAIDEQARRIQQIERGGKRGRN